MIDVGSSLTYGTAVAGHLLFPQTRASHPSFAAGDTCELPERLAWPGVVVAGSQSATRPLAGPDRSIARGRIAPWQNFCLSTLASLSCCRHVSEHNLPEAAFPVLDAWSVPAAGTVLQILIPPAGIA